MKRNIITSALALLCAAMSTTPIHAADELPGMEVQSADYFFTGKPYDEDLASYSFAFRSYNPRTNRWTSIDPSGFPDGSNNHSYVANNPLSRFDALGLEIKVTSGQPQGATAAEIQQAGGGDGFGITTAAQPTVVAAQLATRQNDDGCYQAYVTTPGIYTTNFTVKIANTQQNWAVQQVGTANITAATQADALKHEQGHLSIFSESASRVSSFYDTEVKTITSGWYKDPEDARAKAKLLAGGFLSSAFLRYAEIAQQYNANHTLDGPTIDNGVWKRTTPGWADQFLGDIKKEKVNLTLPTDNTDQCE